MRRGLSLFLVGLPFLPGACGSEESSSSESSASGAGLGATAGATNAGPVGGGGTGTGSGANGGTGPSGGAAGSSTTGGAPPASGGSAASGGTTPTGGSAVAGTPASGGVSGGVSGSAAGTGGSGGAQAGASTGPIAERLAIADVWSGHPVNFALVTHGDRQFAAFYDSERRMTIAGRTLGSKEWKLVRLPTTLGWDSHNHIAMAADSEGNLHVSGNMHNVALIYFRTKTPLDIDSFERVPSMVGTNEQSVTYPEFFDGPQGELIFCYRDGGSGNGNHIFDVYDPTQKSWKRLLETPLTDGEGSRNAYPVGPIQGPDGEFHLVWVWRDTPDATTNHDLSYARSKNLVDWQSAAGAALQLPITLGGSDIVDPVPINRGMINNNTKVGFDSQKRPVVVYHKYDAAGSTQLFNARFEDGKWVAHQTSEWDYRWDFGGQGTLVFEIEVEGVVAQPDGALTQRFYHARYGGWGAFRLDEATLKAVETIEPPLPYPRELDAPESATQGMVVRWQADHGKQGAGAQVNYYLRWETLESNRDMPRDIIPPATTLTLYGFRAAR